MVAVDTGKRKKWKVVSLLGKMLATVNSMQSPKKKHSYVLYLMSLEEPMNKPIV